MLLVDHPTTGTSSEADHPTQEPAYHLTPTAPKAPSYRGTTMGSSVCPLPYKPNDGLCCMRATITKKMVMTASRASSAQRSTRTARTSTSDAPLAPRRSVPSSCRRQWLPIRPTALISTSKP